MGAQFKCDFQPREQTELVVYGDMSEIGYRVGSKNPA